MTLARRTPLARSAFVRKAAPPALARSPIKRRARKKRPWHDKAALETCRGQICHLRVPGVCPRRDPEETIAPCHSNLREHGKAGARKADDKFSLPGCFWCHAWLDQGPAPREEKATVFRAGYARWSAYRDAPKG